MEKTYLTLNDLATLLEVAEGVDQIGKALEILTGTDLVVLPGEGALGKLQQIYDVIRHASPLYQAEQAADPDLDYEETEYGKILDDPSMASVEKARRLLMLD